MTNARVTTTDIADDDATVWVDEGVLHAEGWTTDRPEVVRFFDERLEAEDSWGPAADLLDTVVAAGVLALKTASVAVDADHVAGEVDRLLGTVEEVMAGHGSHLDDMFDPERRDSFVSAMREVMAEHVDGRDSKMARLLDLSHEGSPLRGITDELVKLRRSVEDYRRELEARDAADSARAAERELGTQKGRDFEDVVVDALSTIATGCGDAVEACGDVAGNAGRSKRGDAVVTVSPREACGLSVRVGVEMKDRSLSAKDTRGQLDATKANRDAAAAIAVFARREQMPKGTWPFADLGENRFVCVLEKDDPDDMLVLSLAYRIARHWALADVAGGAGEDIDLRAMRDALDHARQQLEAFTSIKSKVTQLETTVGKSVEAIRVDLDRARAALVESLDRLDAAVEAADDDADVGRAA